MILIETSDFDHFRKLPLTFLLLQLHRTINSTKLNATESNTVENNSSIRTPKKKRKESSEASQEPSDPL